MGTEENNATNLKTSRYDDSVPGGKTRKHLLDAAEKLFATSGYTAASVRQITYEAGCNIAAINYHFGSKERLYQEMFHRLLEELSQARRAVLNKTLADDDATLESLLSDFAKVFYEPLHRDATRAKWIFRLWMREMSEPRLPPRWMFEQFIQPVCDLFRRALRKVCPGLDDRGAQMCIHAFIGHLIHLSHALDLYREVSTEESIYTECLDELLDHAVRYAAAGIRATAGNHQP